MVETRRTERPFRILVAEDQPQALKIFSEALQVAGCEVLTATDRDAGLELAEARPIDVAVVDLLVYGGGFALAAALYGLPNRPAILALTLHDDATAYPNLFDREMTKPIHLVKLVDTVLELARVRREKAARAL